MSPKVWSGHENNKIYLEFTVADWETFKAIRNSLGELKKEFPDIVKTQIQVQNSRAISPLEIQIAVIVGTELLKKAADYFADDLHDWFKKKFGDKIKKKRKKKQKGRKKR